VACSGRQGKVTQSFKRPAKPGLAYIANLDWSVNLSIYYEQTLLYEAYYGRCPIQTRIGLMVDLFYQLVWVRHDEHRIVQPSEWISIVGWWHEHYPMLWCLHFMVAYWIVNNGCTHRGNSCRDMYSWWIFLWFPSSYNGSWMESVGLSGVNINGEFYAGSCACDSYRFFFETTTGI